jgi:hypothetical protein
MMHTLSLYCFGITEVFPGLFEIWRCLQSIAAGWHIALVHRCFINNFIHLRMSQVYREAIRWDRSCSITLDV